MFTIQPIEEPENPEHILQTFEIMDAKNTVMFSSDSPHWDFDNPKMALPPIRFTISKRLRNDSSAKAKARHLIGAGREFPSGSRKIAGIPTSGKELTLGVLPACICRLNLVPEKLSRHALQSN